MLVMPLNNINSRDVLLWKENRAKKFLVRTTYRITVHLKNPSNAEHSSAQCHGPTRGKIWGHNVSPKVRTFLWRVCPYCLPTKENLFRRRVRVDAKFAVRNLKQPATCSGSVPLRGMCGVCPTEEPKSAEMKP
ncbi:hypothetical protein SO802_022891 [Lithocarpus litseifolius]|uniref:Reverse transcriptase zinc-binding domain-containing protein n=1 Tax=Lithocarpus litseifolius TaxID=425828 RepID=A0AAW2C5H0_9ROSI